MLFDVDLFKPFMLFPMVLEVLGDIKKNITMEFHDVLNQLLSAPRTLQCYRHLEGADQGKQTGGEEPRDQVWAE